MDSTLAYYSQHGSMSDPGEHGCLYGNLPDSVPELVRLVQQLSVHVFWAERYGLHVPQERMCELQLRSVQRRLARARELDARSLDEPRSMDKKLLGNCRDYSLLLASFMRHQGIPARARCGFGAYFMPDHFEDHWVTEYWNREQQRWVLVDAQLDALQSKVLQIDFDTLDVPRERFIVAGQAWQMCRSGEQDADRFGIFDMHGLGFVRGNLVRDLASLNKMELLPWDCWGIILQESIDDRQDLAVLDEAAALTAGDVPEFAAMRELYETDPRLRVSDTLFSYVDGNLVQVNMA